MKILLIVPIIFLLHGVCSASYAQKVDARSTTSASSTATLQLNTFAEFTVTPVNASAFAFNSTTSYESGINRSSFSSFVVKSNMNWLLTIRASGAFFAASGGGLSNTLPAGVISFKTNSESTYRTLTTTAQTLRSGAAGGSSQPGNTFSIDLRVAPGYLYNGGLYTLDLVYTLTTQ